MRTRKHNRLAPDVYRAPGRFFVTVATAQRRPWLRDADVADYCADALRRACLSCDFALEAYCFMPDHLHVLALAEKGSDLVRLIHRFKQETGWWFRNRYRAGGLKASPTGRTDRPAPWQRSYFDHVLRRDEDARDVIRYILENPIWAGNVASAEDYRHAWSAYVVPEPA